MKISFFATYDQFVKPIITELTKHSYECSLSNKYSLDDCYNADVIWVDWADHNAVKVMELVTTAKKILRVHAYEAYTDIWQRLNPLEFDVVVFVSEHIKKQVEKTIGMSITNSIIIPPMIDIKKYKYEKSERNNKIAYAGYMCRKKGIGELLMIAESLPDYEFHIAGEPQENDYEYMMQRSPSNVFYYRWQDDLAEFFKDKSYVINTSLRESFSVSTAEAMLCGCIPIVRAWEGSDSIYPQECLFKSIDDIRSILENEELDPHLMPSLIIEKTGLDIAFDKIVAVIHSTTETEMPLPTVTVGIVKTRNKYLPELLHSLRMQQYPIEIKILDNTDKSKSIGACFNELADNCTTDWIVYVGDDDWLAEGYIRNVMEAYINRAYKYPDTVGLTTSTIAFDETGKQMMTPAPSTGFWRAEYIRAERFDETLVRQVDTEFFARKVKRVKSPTSIQNYVWISGYFYRQHSNNISGNKFTEGAITSQEVKK